MPRAVKEDRLQRVIDLQTRIEAEDSQRLVGSVQELLLDGAHAKKRGYLNGRTEGYRPVTAYAPHLEIGDFVSVRITGHRGHWLEGEIVP
ncbi:MAG: (Dimethylallyl)adenosine tRNA methylthiotransferase MiaB [candidate division BRC1 bacterium ADurb.BinA364]|nr:MAG: (Dimethylallyl)adenosine tRNA methylthiotransferase MiaB [candidate division BRC1 bacterium ADurb.BinA364]